MDWYGAERPALLAAIELAARTGLDTYAWRLAATVSGYLQRRGHWREQIVAQETALAAAARRARPGLQAQAHRRLALAHAESDQLDRAHTHYLAALELSGTIGDRSGQASGHLGIGWILQRRGRHAQALHHAERALHHYREADDRAGQAKALNNIGWQHGQLGEFHAALTHCQEALALHQEIGDYLGEPAAWDSLGYAHHQLGNYPLAIACFERAADQYRTLGNRRYEADTLEHIGDAHQQAGNPVAARRAWLNALTILDEIDHPDGDSVRAKLHRTGLAHGHQR
jgi:tetratricopeptide (TPR) repeat protein